MYLLFCPCKIEEQGVTSTDIAEHFDISRNYLVKVLQHLGRLNYIHTTRAKIGGLRLAHTPHNICIGDVVRNMETNLDIVNCEPPSPCPIQPLCRLKGILEKVGNAFLDVLDQYTIAAAS